MVRKFLFPSLFISMSMLTVCSCSIFNPGSTSKEVPASATHAQTQTSPSTSSKSSSTATAPQVVKPEKDSKKSTPSTPAPKTTPAKKLSADAAMLAGEWVIEQVGSTKIDREENYPYVNFVPEEDAFYASNGCNVLNGGFSVKDKKLTFHNVLATMRYCPDAPFDTEINAVLADEKPVNIVFDEVQGLPYLYLTNNQGEKLMVLHKAGLDFLNGDWEVVDIQGEDFSNSDMSIFFDVEERKVHGNTGCNSFNGEIFVDPLNARQISLSNLAVTMRMCPNIAQQSKYLVALEETAGARAAGSKTVFLTDSDGNVVITLKARE